MVGIKRSLGRRTAREGNQAGDWIEGRLLSENDRAWIDSELAMSSFRSPAADDRWLSMCVM